MLKLREGLLEAQFELREKGKFQVFVLISGMDGAGKGETLNDLYGWMDPRYLSACAFAAPTGEETAYPFMWRFWRGLPLRESILCRDFSPTPVIRDSSLNESFAWIRSRSMDNHSSVSPVNSASSANMRFSNSTHAYRRGWE